MKRKILTIFTIFLLASTCLGTVSAENITETENDRIGEKVKASESGHYNISFDDGYSGYCINYGDYEADHGDSFVVSDTSKAVNNNNRESIGNYLKTFFVEYHDIATNDKYDTQKIIWAFSDDFNYERELVKEIKEVSKNKVIPDQGAVKQINNTTEATFYFEVLDSVEHWTQNFFAYKIVYNTILPDEGLLDMPEEPENNETLENETVEDNLNNEENITVNETENNNDTVLPDDGLLGTPEEPQNNTTIENETVNNPNNNTTVPEDEPLGTPEKPENNTTIENETVNNPDDINNNTNTTVNDVPININDDNNTKQTVNVNLTDVNEDNDTNTTVNVDKNDVTLSKHVTGNSWIAIILLIGLLLFLVMKYRRD